MKRLNIRRWVWLLCLLPLCVAAKPRYVVGDYTKFPHIRFGGQQTSWNDRCPVSRTKLNRRMDPVYINGRPIGFC